MVYLEIIARLTAHSLLLHFRDESIVFLHEEFLRIKIVALSFFHLILVVQLVEKEVLYVAYDRDCLN